MESITDVKINLQRPNAVPIIYAKQGDKYTRKIRATLYDGDTPWVPPNNVYTLVRCAKPDRTSVVYDKLENNTAAVITSSGSSTVTIGLRQQVTAADGDVRLEVNFYAKNGTVVTEQLTTFSVIVRVEKSAVDNVILESTSEFDILTNKINQVLEAEQALAGIEVNAIQNYTSTSPSVNVTRSQSDNHYIFNFGLPKGNTGDPASVTSREVSYYQTDTFINNPATGIASGNWQSTMPTPIAQQYMYTRVADTYNNNTIKYSYSVARNGRNGSGSVDSVNNKEGDVQLTASDVGTMTTSEINTAIETAVQNALTSYLADYIQVGYCYKSVAKKENSPNTYNVSVPITIPDHLQGTHIIGGILGFTLSYSVPAAAISEIVLTGNNPHVILTAAGTIASGALPFDYHGTNISVYVLYVRNTFTSS